MDGNIRFLSKVKGKPTVHMGEGVITGVMRVGIQRGFPILMQLNGGNQRRATNREQFAGKTGFWTYNEMLERFCPKEPYQYEGLLVAWQYTPNSAQGAKSF